eukprot:403330803
MKAHLEKLMMKLILIPQINQFVSKLQIDLTKSLVEGLQNKQITLTNDGINRAENFADFPLLKANNFAKTLWTKYGFNQVSSRDELVQKLDKATKDLSQ